MEKFLADFISNNIQSEIENDLSLLVICQNSEEKDCLLFADSKRKETLISKFLVLLFDTSTKLILTGIDAYLYVGDTSENRLFIKYVDTTGFFSPRTEQSKVTKLLVEGFIRAVGAEKLNLSSIAKPSYLFPLSQLNPIKRSIDGKRLFSWWKVILENTYESVKWFSPCLNNSNQFLEDVPLFPEDVKSSQLQNIFSNVRTVSSHKIYTSLELVHDFASNWAAIFHCSKIKMKLMNDDLISTFECRVASDSKINDIQNENSVCKRAAEFLLHTAENSTSKLENAYDIVYSILQNSSFDTFENTLLASQLILEYFPKLHSFSLTPKSPSTSSIKIKQHTQVNDLQSLIKKRKRNEP